METTSALLAQLRRLLDEGAPPGGGELKTQLQECMDIFTRLPAKIRPADFRGLPGGLVRLRRSVPTLILPDLHGRRRLLFDALTQSVMNEESFLDLLEIGSGNVVCVGDAFHGEAPVKERWSDAYDEFLDGFKHREAMDQEMTDNLRLLQMILLLTIHYPENFFFLKGNHENIANELGEGNYPFRKFVNEGEMVKYWSTLFLGQECFEVLYGYEKRLPLVAEGDGFLVTHAEPSRVFSVEEIIDAYKDDDVIYGLTWTDNDVSEPGSVAGTLESFFPGEESTICFGGHRPTGGLYALRAEGRYIQINNPVNHIAAVVSRGGEFDPDEQIVRIDTL
ncbi:MAG: metallophosphoesterase [Spirochaetales bacterium]|nr:metallophosphoesterase [Spirochaetales bacterium]